MKILYHDSPESPGIDLVNELTARGYQMVPLIGEARPSSLDVCLLFAPPILTDAISAVHEVRRLLLPQTPILVAGPWRDRQQVQSLLTAGAADYCQTPTDIHAVEARLQVMAHHSRLTAAEDAGQLRQRLLLQTHHSEALVSITHSVGHDFNNLLAAIQGNAELALLDLRLDSRLRHNLEQIEKAARRAAELTRQVLEFSNTNSMSREIRPLSLSGLIRDMGELLRVSVPKSCRVEHRLGRTLPLIAGNAVRLRQLVLTLAGELAAALGPGGGTIQLRTSLAAPDTPQEVLLEIEATPAQPAAEERARDLFAAADCWLDDKHAAAAIIFQHHGHLTTERSAESGIRIRIALPMVGNNASGGPRPAGPALPEATGATVLLIDDEEQVRMASQRLLRRAGYTVLEAASGEEGLALFEQVGAALDIVVLDLNMPGMGSREVIRHIRELRPQQRIVVWSGFSEEKARAQLADISDLMFIEKPAELSDFPLALGRVLAA
jgi:DNA-binding response OmpR family regulator